MNGEMQIHEVANIFPEMDNASFAALKADIKANGLLEPIWIHDGKIIDGRHRYRACCELEIKPQFKQWDGSGSLVQFVVSLNLHRRHLTSSQLAFVGVDILPHLEAEAKQRQETGNNQHSLRELIPQGSTGKSADQAADVVGSNGRYVSDAKKLQAEAPALAAQVRAGGKTIRGNRKHRCTGSAQAQQPSADTNHIGFNADGMWTNTSHLLTKRLRPLGFRQYSTFSFYL